MLPEIKRITKCKACGLYGLSSQAESHPSPQPQALHDSWVSFLTRFEPYDWYCTLTFQEPTHPEQADKRFKRFIRRVNEDAWGKRYREKGKGVYYAKAIEWQRRDVLHFHALIGGGVSRLKRRTYKDYWYIENGFARIEAYDSNRGAKGYLSKYVSKNGEIDIYIPPYLQKLCGCSGKLPLFTHNNNMRLGTPGVLSLVA